MKGNVVTKDNARKVNLSLEVSLIIKEKRRGKR